MRNSVIIFIQLFFGLNISTELYSQEIPADAKFVELISAKTYSKGKVVQSNDQKYYLDSNRERLKEQKQSKNYWVTILKTEREEVEALITGSDTTTILGKKYNERGELIFNYQLSGKDTISKQKRLYTKLGLDSLLFSWLEGEMQRLNRIQDENFPVDPKENEYMLSAKWEYINDTVLSKQYFYSFDGDSIINKYETKGSQSDVFELVEGKFVLIQSTVKLSKKKEKIYYYKDSEGYNYGVTIGYKKDGYAIKEYDDFGKLISFETFFKSGTIINSIKITYKALN